VVAVEFKDFLHQVDTEKEKASEMLFTIAIEVPQSKLKLSFWH